MIHQLDFVGGMVTVYYQWVTDIILNWQVLPTVLINLSLIPSIPSSAMPLLLPLSWLCKLSTPLPMFFQSWVHPFPKDTESFLFTFLLFSSRTKALCSVTWFSRTLSGWRLFPNFQSVTVVLSLLGRASDQAPGTALRTHFRAPLFPSGVLSGQHLFISPSQAVNLLVSLRVKEDCLLFISPKAMFAPELWGIWLHSPNSTSQKFGNWDASLQMTWPKLPEIPQEGDAWGIAHEREKLFSLPLMIAALNDMMLDSIKPRFRFIYIFDMSDPIKQLYSYCADVISWIFV